MLKNMSVRLVSCWILVVSVLLAGCFPVYDPPSTRPPSPVPTGAPPTTSTPAVAEEPLPPLGMSPTPTPPYPIPPGSRTSRTGQLSTGTVAKAGTITVERNGTNVIEVDDPKHPLFGLAITIPPQSYQADRQLTVSYAPISNSTFKNVNPVSPLITVETGGGYADELITLKVPAKVAPGDFAMGFYYDSKTGQLEGLPLLDYDTTSVTVATRHFSSFFVSSITGAVLDAAIMSGDIDSGFRPGIDDWQFVNRGSYIAPGGHCAGQSLTALWYYVNYPDGLAASLWNRYDRNGQKPGTPSLWEDDSQAYRLASVIQKDIDWSSWENKLMTEMAGKSDALTLRAFAYAMYITGEPQEVGIFSSKGGGHDMIGYRVKDNAIYIADPNYPGNGERRIEYDQATGKFKPYNSGANAEEIAAGRGKAYETIQYAAKTASIDWDIIGARWNEMKAGKVGNDLFPKWEFRYLDEKGKPQNYVSGMTFSLPNLYILPLLNGETSGAGAAYLRDRKQMPFDPDKGIELKPGKNVIEAVIYGVPNPANKKWKYVDFTTLTINYSGLKLEPSSLEGVINNDYTFKAVLPGAPNDTRYEWTLNGTRQSTTAASVTFSTDKAGTYTLGVKAFDKANQELGAATATAIIRATATPRPTPTPTTAPPASGNLAKLQKSKRIRIDFNVATTEVTRIMPSGSQSTAESGLGLGGTVNINWNGTSFSGTGQSSYDRYTFSFSGVVSPDGSRIVSLTYTEVSKQTASNLTSTLTSKIQLANLPLDWSTGSIEWIGQQIEGAGVKPYVSNVESVYVKALTDGSLTRTVTSWRVDGDSRLVIQFLFI